MYNSNLLDVICSVPHGHYTTIAFFEVDMMI